MHTHGNVHTDDVIGAHTFVRPVRVAPCAKVTVYDRRTEYVLIPNGRKRAVLPTL